MRLTQKSIARLLASAALAALLAAATTGCQTTQKAETTGSLSVPSESRSEADWRREVETWGALYRSHPDDTVNAIQYAQALRATGQRAQAAAVLEQASIQERNSALEPLTPGFMAAIRCERVVEERVGESLQR